MHTLAAISSLHVLNVVNGQLKSYWKLDESPTGDVSKPIVGSETDDCLAIKAPPQDTSES